MSSPTVDHWRSPTSRVIRCVDLNDNISCSICKGYLIDATTVIECLHSCKCTQSHCRVFAYLSRFSFAVCRTCILQHIEKSVVCPHPNCERVIHDTKPHEGIRPDPTLQDIVYKVVPNLFRSTFAAAVMRFAS